MTTLLKRLSRLSGDNPVQWVKVTPDDWAEISRLVEDAERYRWLRSAGRMPHETKMVFEKDDWRLDSAIDAARAAAAKGD